MKKKDPIKGASLKPAPMAKAKPMPKKEAASVALEKTRKTQASQAEAKRKSTNKKTAIAGAVAAAGVGAKLAWDNYHMKLKNQYHDKYGSSSQNPGPYGVQPNNRSLRKWNKENK
jgi:hypothetical protein